MPHPEPGAGTSAAVVMPTGQVLVVLLPTAAPLVPSRDAGP